MNLLNKLTKKNLKMNKKRTTVTIIGIILSTALITAVSGITSSFRESIVEYEKSVSGNYHYAFYDVPVEELKYIKNNRNIKEYFLIEDIGYAELEGNKSVSVPYLHLSGLSEEAFENAGITLLDGRYPVNENELVIARQIKTTGGVDYKVGDVIELNVGRRVTTDGQEIPRNERVDEEVEEWLDELFVKEYTVVGIAQINLQFRTPAGYPVLTYVKEDDIDENADIYTVYTDQALKKQYEVTADLLGVDAEDFRNYENPIKSKEEYDSIKEKLEIRNYEYDKNSYLIKYQTFEFGSTTMSMMYRMAGIALVIIILTSVFCIRNSFEISITEKKKQYGMLASVGATSKQIKKNVHYEVFYLGMIGIPLGVLTGILATWILIRVTGNLMLRGIGFEMVFSLSWAAILLGILLSLITLFFSARKIARKTAKVSPISAIRGNEDIKIKAKKIKSPKIIKKLFGIGGVTAYKNLKRERKKYRTTVISIVISVAVFIAMFTFIDIAFTATNVYHDETTYQLSIFTGRYDINKEQIHSIIKQDGVNRVSVERSLYVYSMNQDLKFSQEYSYAGEGNQRMDISLMAIGEEEYERYLKNLGLNYEQTKDKAILINDFLWYMSEEDKYMKGDIYDYKKGDRITMGSEWDYEKNEQIGDGITFEIATVTDQRPLGRERYNYSAGCLVVSDEWYDTHFGETGYVDVYIQCDHADRLEEIIENEYNLVSCYIKNREEEYRNDQAFFILIAIFLYGFIAVIALIGITNIFNTLSTSMGLRSKEFAMLKSIGITRMEFNKMVSLESFFYGTKSLVIGIPIGLFFSYLFNKALSEGVVTRFQFPTIGVLISIFAVYFLVFCIMRYSVKKINSQNIIETIRKDTI